MRAKVPFQMVIGRGGAGLGNIKRLQVSIQHGYLWIGDADKAGPCLAVISGKKTLLKLAAMVRAHAR